MIFDISTIDYSVLDTPEVSMFIFHPRSEGMASPIIADKDLLIPVAPDVKIGACFHMTSVSAPTILFFHGNGEIVADYNDMGQIYNQRGINFLAVDYRGYGRSNGKPTVTAMMQDAHVIFEFVQKWLTQKGYKGPLMLMGRSLGSASAIELAFHYPDNINALIIESGFAYAEPLLKLLGVNVKAIGFEESQGFCNAEKIKKFNKPVLIIHARQDHIIPFSDGQALYEASSSVSKTILPIAGANHNDLLYVGFEDYMNAIETLARQLKKERTNY